MPAQCRGSHPICIRHPVGVGEADTLKGRAAVQKDPDRNLTKSSKVKCQFVSLRRRNCWQTYRLGEQLCCKGSVGPGGPRAEREPVMHPVIKHSQQHPVLH